MGIKANGSYTDSDSGKTLWDELVKIERIDSRERRMHQLCQKWSEELDKSEGLAMSNVAIFNWMADLEIEILPNKVMYITVTRGKPHVHAQWLPRMLPAALKAFKCHHVQIAGLRDWKWPPDDPLKGKKEKATQDAPTQNEGVVDIPM